MSDKRFKEIYGSKEDIIGVVDNVSGKKMVCTLDLIQEMNELAEENEELHIENTKLLSERIQDLEEFGECILKAEKIAQENLQLKTQISIFKKFLEENDLNVIDFGEFCTLDSCIFDEPNFDCRECVYIGVRK